MEWRKRAIYAGRTARLGTSDGKRVAFVVFNPESRVSTLVLDLDGSKINKVIWLKETIVIGLIFLEKLFDLGA